MKEILQNNILLNCALDLKKNMIGVKFFFNKEEFDSVSIPQIKNTMPYCVMVKSASRGNTIKATVDNFKCPGGSKALKMMELDEKARSGQHYYELGLNKDVETAKKFQESLAFCSKAPYGVLLQPLSLYESDITPDIIITITNPYNIMRFMQGYSYSKGMCTNIQFAGSQAICSEVTARPYESRDINVSVMCSGTRFWNGWDENDMAVGMPAEMFNDVVEGILGTLNAVEPLEKKNEIVERFSSKGIEFDIEYDKSYYWDYKAAQERAEKGKAK